MNEQFYLLGMLVDADGLLKGFDVFQNGAEFFFKYLEFGWNSYFANHYLTSIHTVSYHTDEHSEYDTEPSWASQYPPITYDRKLMIFGGFGVSCGWDSDTPVALLSRRSFMLGVGFYTPNRTDVIGSGLNWFEPSAESLKVQRTVELAYRYQFAENLAITT